MNFEDRVQRQIKRFTTQKYQDLELEITRLRMEWANDNNISPNPGASLRETYEMLFFDFMGLEPEGVPVLSETDERLVWSSVNPCGTLEACRRTGIDTRTVCRQVYEKSTQALVSRFDPQIRFHRSYDEIRPHSHHCLEWLQRLDFERLMRMALEEARKSLGSGNQGFGAVVTFDNQVLARAYDTVISQGDPDLHACANALREAVDNIGDRNLCGAVLFTNCEPCAMCASLAAWANVTTIVYGLSIEAMCELGKPGVIDIPAEEIIERSSRWVEVIGGVLEEECKQLYR